MTSKLDRFTDDLVTLLRTHQLDVLLPRSDFLHLKSDIIDRVSWDVPEWAVEKAE